MEVSFIPYVAPEIDPYLNDPKIVFIYNVTSTEEDTLILGNEYRDTIESMEIDGVELNEIVNTYRFNTIGEHVIKYAYSGYSGNNTNLKCLTSVFVYENGLSIDEAYIPITSAYIPNTIESIDVAAFKNCTQLTSIILGNSVNFLSTNAFKGCSNLSSIRCATIIAPQIVDDSFQNIAANGILYVPTGATGYDTWLTALGNGWTKVEF